MIRSLEIVWKHDPCLTEVPVITSDTKKTFCELLKELKPAFKQEDILLNFSSELVPGDPEEGRRITLNGKALEDILLEVAGEQRQCDGRRCEMNKQLVFPFVSRGDIQYLSVPDLIIRKTFLRAVGII